MVKSATIRLVITLEPDPEKAGRFVARLEGTGEVIVAGTRQPLVDGARELLARGFDPATPITLRVEGKSYDSFRPMPIAEWANWTYTESEKHALKRQRWMPLPHDRERQKSGSEPLVAPDGRETENRLHAETEQRRGGYPDPTALLGREA